MHFPGNKAIRYFSLHTHNNVYGISIIPLFARVLAAFLAVIWVSTPRFHRQECPWHPSPPPGHECGLIRRLKPAVNCYAGYTPAAEAAGLF
jgi:hypothetical protein